MAGHIRNLTRKKTGEAEFLAVEDDATKAIKALEKERSSGDDSDLHPAIGHHKARPQSMERPVNDEDMDPDVYVPKLSEDGVFEAANQHDQCEHGSAVLKDLPRFDDPTRCGLKSPQANQKLLRSEIRRLMKVASSSEPFLFDSEGILDSASGEVFQNVSSLADQILCNFAVIALDNAAMTLDHNGHNELLVSISATTYRWSHSTLLKRYRETEKVKPMIPAQLKNPEDNRKAYFALVDFATGAVARILVRSAVNEYLDNEALAILALWAVKLKVLSYSPGPYAEESLANAEDVLAQLTSAEKKATVLKVKSANTKEGENGSIDMDVHEDSDPTLLYFLRNVMIRDPLAEIFRTVFLALYTSPLSYEGAENFQMSTLVYETGLERSLIALHEDRNGSVATSPVSTHLKSCYGAMTLVSANMSKLKKLTVPLPSRSTSSSSSSDALTPRAKVIWHFTKEHRDTSFQEQSLGLANIDHIISVLGPLALSGPYVASAIQSVLQSATSRSGEYDHVRYFKSKHFQARCTVMTSGYTERHIRPAFVSSRTPDAVPISVGQLSRRIRAGTLLSGAWSEKMLRTSITGGQVAVDESSASILEQCRKDEQKMSTWVAAENTITVKCQVYVAIVLTLCTVLMTGALAVPFLVRNKVKGVDPFQMTTFCWLVVGVILVIAKSRYVSEWPWHDFLHGRVVCDSVTDLADVTGVDPQVILTRLLHNELQTTLVSRGPYNGMFSRKAEKSTGFSIDVPVQLSTMLASGFIILKVLSDSGEHVISLNARKGARIDYAERFAASCQYLSCLDLQKKEPSDSMTPAAKSGKAKNVLYLTENYIRWNKLLGLYVSDVSFG